MASRVHTEVPRCTSRASDRAESNGALSERGEHRGSKALLAAIEQKRPRLIVCGHVHLARGGIDAPWGRLECVAALDEGRVPNTPAFLTMRWKGARSRRKAPRSPRVRRS
jgi:hypothetical protein